MATLDRWEAWEQPALLPEASRGSAHLTEPLRLQDCVGALDRLACCSHSSAGSRRTEGAGWRQAGLGSSCSRGYCALQCPKGPRSSLDRVWGKSGFQDWLGRGHMPSTQGHRDRPHKAGCFPGLLCSSARSVLWKPGLVPAASPFGVLPCLAQSKGSLEDTAHFLPLKLPSSGDSSLVLVSSQGCFQEAHRRLHLMHARNQLHCPAARL